MTILLDKPFGLREAVEVPDSIIQRGELRLARRPAPTRWSSCDLASLLHPIPVPIDVYRPAELAWTYLITETGVSAWAVQVWRIA